MTGLGEEVYTDHKANREAALDELTAASERLGLYGDAPDNAVEAMVEEAARAIGEATVVPGSRWLQSQARAALESLGVDLAVLAAIRAGTWVAVPVKHTAEMYEAWTDADLNCEDEWRAFLAAAPQDPGGMTMTGVNELADLLRKYASHRTFAASKTWEEAVTEAADALETLAGENAELNALFDLQHTRMAEATQLWRRETGRENVSPDLGRLLEWLMERYAQEVIVSESRLAKLAPVVEAARTVTGPLNDGVPFHKKINGLIDALATMEAAHD